MALYCQHRRRFNSYWSLALPAEAPLEHNFRYPRIRELSVMGGAIALGGQGALFLFLFSSLSLSLLISSLN